MATFANCCQRKVNQKIARKPTEAKAQARRKMSLLLRRHFVALAAFGESI